MFEGLDDVDWDNLEHAYGKASDVPILLKDLISKDPETRENALWELYGNIYHQGTRYEATVYAIPFIFQVIRAPTTPQKADLIRFTVDLALGYPEAFLPKGPNVEDWMDDVAYLKIELEEEDNGNKDYLDWYKHIDAYIDCYKAVLKEVPTYIQFVKDTDENIRLNAIFALAWFREEAKTSITKIRELLKKEENPILIASILITLSMLGAYLNDISDRNIFKQYIDGEYSFLIKISAAIGMINILQENTEKETLDFLISNLEKLSQLETSPGSFPWNDGDLVGYVADVLKFFGVESPEIIVPAFCNILKKLTGFRAFNLINALFWIVFPDIPDGDQWTLKELNKYQKQVLRVIAGNINIWESEELDYENLSLLLKDFKLPSTLEGLKKLLNIN
ncbi:MAG: HEAT repeat domain-containing protein [Promethearchaeota archaeon]|nr:MAG: HEAT repeat domain-containing protein [Candidatus Lokiarchaeota archaeon]